MIALAAAKWKLNPRDTVSRLASVMPMASGSDADRYVTRVHRFDRMKSLFERDPESSSLRQVTSALELTTTDDPGRWKERLGQFATVARPDDVEKAMASRGEVPTRLFIGSWDNVLAVAFQDVPGRIRGIWAKDREHDPVFLTGPPPGEPETGLGMLQSALSDDPDPDFGRKVFVVNDVAVAVRLHDRSFQFRSRPLPVLASVADELRWARFDSGLFAGKDLIFWSAKLSIAAVRQAKAGDGRLATGDGVNEPPLRHLSRFSPTSWLQFVDDNAIHWTEALDRLLAQTPDTEAEALLTIMNLSADEKSRFLRSCSGAVRNRLVDLYGPNMNRRIHINDRIVLESHGHWYSIDPKSPTSQSLISDGTFRIEQVIQVEGSPEALYRIRAYFKSKSVSFSVPVKDFDKNPFGIVRDELIKSGLGLLSYSKSWSQNGVAIATQFWQPEFVFGAGRCGWCDARAAWVFETFAIDASGRVQDDGVAVLGEHRPTARLARPSEVHPDSIRLLSRDDEFNQLVWATTACLVANLVAPVTHHPTSGIALVGEGAEFAGYGAARLLGCDDYNLPIGWGTDFVVSVLQKREHTHGWPLSLKKSKASRAYHTTAWLSSEGSRNCVVELPWCSARAISLRGGWHILESDRPFTSIAEYTEALPTVIPAYLKWFGNSRLALPDDQSLGHSVLSSLADWFQSLGGDRDAVLSALRVTVFDRQGQHGAALDHLEYILCRLYESGELYIGARPVLGRPGKRLPLFPYSADGNLFIPKADLNRLLAIRGAPVPDSSWVTQSLSENGVLIQETEIGTPPLPGWEVRREWWDKSLERWKRRHNLPLRVVG